MGDQGWICLHRKLRDNALWKTNRVFSKAEAWIDILLEAQHSPETATVLLGMTVIECGYGQSIKSLGTWGDRWNWSNNKVWRFLKLLEEMKMIRTENVKKTTRITVCNYGLYNDPQNANRTQIERTQNARRNRQQCNNDNNGNNKEKHCENSPPKITESQCRENFELARKLYPGKKRGPDVEFENFKKKHSDWRDLLDDDGLEQCVQTLMDRKAYSADFWPMFQTFCNQSRYEEALT